jgi:hypothetical protein
MTPVAVVFPVFNRPHLLDRVLQSWSKVRGVENAVLGFHCEPGCEEAVALCESVDFAARHVYVNAERLGHAENVLRSMDSAFLITDYAIQALDDCLVAADILELHAWHRKNYAADPTVLALTASRDAPAPDADLAAVWRCQLIGALSGFHRPKWDMLAGRWHEGTANWWQWVNEHWLQSGPRYDVLFPALSRGEDIGDIHFTSCFASDPPPQAYYEVRQARERACGFARYYEEYRNQ